jgi:hypothetical protein
VRWLAVSGLNRFYICTASAGYFGSDRKAHGSIGIQAVIDQD